MIDKIPPLRLLVYTIILALVPVLAASIHLYTSGNDLAAVKERITQLRQQVLLQEQKQAGNRAVIAHYRDADHFYIDKFLETITLMESEIQALSRVAESKNYTGDETIQKRLEHLTGEGNRIVFTEGVVQSHKLFQETTETLNHPVEASVEDIKKLVAAIEGVPVGPHIPPDDHPQLIILDFKIDKKNISENNQAYTLNLKLLKREFL